MMLNVERQSGAAMTKTEWDECSIPQTLVEFLQAGTSTRKLRLCAVAWARLVMRQANTTPRMDPYQQWIANPQLLPQLGAAEQFADGQIDSNVLRSSRLLSGRPYNIFRATCRVSHFSLDDVYRSLRAIQVEFGAPSDREVCDLTRDIIYPFQVMPFRTLWLSWNNATIPKLAQSIYEERAFDRLPILADALEEAGCTNPDILQHCRQPREHVRGCWPVDLLLGRE
jgi:hypothetical protein